MKEIIAKFKSGQCVFLSSNPETKMTVASYQTKTTIKITQELTGQVLCVWLYEGNRKEGNFNQDLLISCT